MKSEARGEKIFFLISILIVLCTFLTGQAIAQRISISEAKPILIQEDEDEAEKLEDLLPVGLLEEAPTGYIERDYRILTQEYGAVTPSTVSIRRLSENQGIGILDINPLMFGSEPVLIAPGQANYSISPATLLAFPSVYSSLRNSNGYLTDYSSMVFGANDIFRYNRLNNAYNYNYGYNSNYSQSNSNLFGWYGLPYGHDIISTWAGNTYNKFIGYEQYLPDSYSYLLNQFITSKRSNTQESGIDTQEPDPVPPAQLEEADAEVYADADGGAITLSEGETLSIVLESNVTTGYRWDLNVDLLDSQVLAQTNAQYLSGPIGGDEPLLGAGGYEQWIFKTIGVGTTTIELNYKRSWDEEIADTFMVEVTVQPANAKEGQIGLANPASVYCIENGGISEIRTNEFGSYGVCIFNDGTECDEWAYFRGECGQ